MFFVCTDGSGIYDVVALTKFYLRWESGLNLLFNLAYFNANLLSFSHKLFIEESLMFNWNLCSSNYKLFKFAQDLIYFRETPYGEDSKDLYEDSDFHQLDAAIVTDIRTHKKNSFFLRKMNIYTFGLVPANYSPWLLSFSLPLIGDSLLGQYYFFSVVIRITNSAKALNFDILIRKWDVLKRILLPLSTSPKPNLLLDDFNISNPAKRLNLSKFN